MSLNWDLTKIKNFKEVCYLEGGNDKEGFEHKPATHNLIWATMAITMGEITEKNYLEFYTRISLWDRMHNFSNDSRITIKQVHQHIGLTTNVFPKKTNAAWLKVLFKNYTRDIARQTEIEREELEDA